MNLRNPTILPIADAVLAAIPADTTFAPGILARADAARVQADPDRWIDEQGDNLQWALEQLVEATADYTINGWEDDLARSAFEEFMETQE